MQLEKIVQFHKALADPNRLRILILLASGEKSGQSLAEELHLSAPTVTHHAAKLREAALIHERRDKNTIFFSLDEYFLRQHSTAALELIAKSKSGKETADSMEISMNAQTNSKLKESVLKNFFTKDGKLKHLPAQYKKKLIVLEHLVEQLKPGRAYAEKEINEFVQMFHEDFATIRREFIMHQYMYREGNIYELNPRELWSKWENVR